MHTVKKRGLFVLSLASLAVLAGCATAPGSCDPRDRDAGFLTKINCDASGGYRQTIDQREQNIAKSLEENAQFQAVLEAIEQQRMSLQRDLAQRQRTQSEVVASTQNLLNQLKAKNSSNAAIQNQVRAAQRDLDALKATPPAPAANAQEIAQKQAQLQDLQQRTLRLQQSLGYGQ